MANVFGGNSSGTCSTSRQNLSSSRQTSSSGGSASSSPNVFNGGGSSGSCSTGGQILSAPKTTVSSAGQVSSSPNVLKGGGSGVNREIDIRDYYTRRQIDKALASKIDSTSVYTNTEVYNKSEVDEKITALSLSNYATDTELSTAVSALESQVNNNLTSNYYQSSILYTKSQVDSLISGVSVSGDYVSRAPSSITEITISPSSTSLPFSLLVRSSNNTETTEVQRWENTSTDFLAAIYADGKAKFTNYTSIGENVSSGNIALFTNNKRVSGVANPVSPSDAVNKLYMETFITTTLDDVINDVDENYIVDALEY